MFARGLSPALRVSLLYAALTLLFAYPFPFHAWNHALDDGTDPQLWIWTMSWVSHAFVTQPFSIFDANIFYPFHHTLAYSEALVGSAFIAAPVLWITGNPVFMLNFMELLSAFLCAVGGYVLGRKVGLRPTSAFVAGLIFGFSPARFLRIDQFHLTTIQWMPFSLAFLHAYFDKGRSRDLKLAIAFFSLQALTSGHGASFLLVACVVLTAFRLATGMPLDVLRRVRDAGVTGALILLPAVLGYLPYRAAAKDVVALTHDVDPGASLASYFASVSVVHQAILAHAPAWMTTAPDAELFPGIVPIVLGAIALWWPWRAPERRTRPGTIWRVTGGLLFLAALAVIGLLVYVSVTGETRIRAGHVVLISARSPSRLWFMLGAIVAFRALLAWASVLPLNVAARMPRPVQAMRRWFALPTSRLAAFYGLLTLVGLLMTMGPPYGLWQWVYWLPGLSFIRVSSRFILLGVLALAMLAAVGLERITGGMTAARRMAVTILVSAFFTAESLAIPFSTRPLSVDIPAVDRWLDTQPKPFVVAEVPMPRSYSDALTARYNTRYMLHSMAHWQKTVHGYSGVEPPFHTRLLRSMTRFPDDESLNALVDLGVTYVVMHRDLYQRREGPEADERMEKYAGWLTLVHQDGDGRVYTLKRPPAAGAP